MPPRIDVIIGAKVAEFSKGIKDAKKELNEWGQGLEKVPGFSKFKDFVTNPIVAASVAATSFVKSMQLAVVNAERLQVIGTKIAGTLKDAQLVQGAARGDGQITEDQLVQWIGKVREAQGGALRGGKEQIDAWAELGVSIEQVAGLSPLDLLTGITKRFEAGAVSAKEYAAANKLLGQSFEDLLPAAERGLAARLRTESMLDPHTQNVRAAQEVGGMGRRAWGATKGAFNWLTTTTVSGLLGLGRLTGALGAQALTGDWFGPALGLTEPNETAVDLLTAREQQFGPSQTNMERLEIMRMRQQQRKMLLEQLKGQNAMSGGMLAFEGLDPQTQLDVLRRTQATGAAGIGSLSAVEQENQMAALLVLQREILATEKKVEEHLKSIEREQTAE